MAAFEFTAIGTGLAKVADLLDKLKKKSKDREVAEIMGQFQDAFFETKGEALNLHAKNFELTAKITELELEHRKAMEQLASTHLAEMAQLNARHLLEIANLKPKQDDLTAEATSILKVFFELAREFCPEDVASNFQISQSLAAHHMDELSKRRLIRHARNFDSYVLYEITPEGRAYIVNKVLAK